MEGKPDFTSYLPNLKLAVASLEKASSWSSSEIGMKLLTIFLCTRSWMSARPLGVFWVAFV